MEKGNTIIYIKEATSMNYKELLLTMTVNGTQVDLTPDLCIGIYQTYELVMHDRQDIVGNVTMMQLFELTLEKCYAYEKAGQTFKLNNEVGVLRGLALALSTVGIYPRGEEVTHFIGARQSSSRNDGPLPS